MSDDGAMVWASLERRSAQLFIIGAVILVGTAAIALNDVVQGTELRLPLGQVFVGAGWAAVLVGMLGLYPELADRRPWLARACALFAGIGAFGYGLMAVGFAAAVGGLPMSTLKSITPVFLLPSMIGTFLAFPLFAVAGLLTGAYSRAVSVLLATPTVIFVANVLTGPTPDSIFGVVVALILVFGTIGYLLRTDPVTTERAEPAREPTLE